MKLMKSQARELKQVREFDCYSNVPAREEIVSCSFNEQTEKIIAAIKKQQELGD